MAQEKSGKLTEPERIKLACEHCLVLRENTFDLLPQTFLDRVALEVYKHCVMPRLRVKTRQTHYKQRPRKAPSTAWNEIHAAEGRLNKREQVVAGREKNLSYYETQTRAAEQKLRGLQEEVERLETTKRSLEKDLEDLRLGFISSINIEHLSQLPVCQMCEALTRQLSNALSTDRKAMIVLAKIKDALASLAKYADHLTQKRAQAHRQF